MKCTNHRQTPHKFWNQTILNKIFYFYKLQKITFGFFINIGCLPIKTDHFFAYSASYNIFQSNECTTANKKDVCCIDRNISLLRMLTSTLRRNIGHRAF